MSVKAELGVVDYVVFSGMLLISAAIGIYYRCTGGKQKTVQEYLLADKTMSVLPVSFSLMASFLSAITLLGLTSEMYMYGTQFIITNITYLTATPFCAYFFLPVFFRMNCISVYEYLEHRFGRPTRIAAAIAFSLQMILYMGVVLYAPSLAVSAVTDLSTVVSVITVGAVCTFYSTIGGMKAVLVTDVVQSLFMFATIFTVIGVGVYDVGGFEEVWNAAQEGGRVEFFNFNPDPSIRHTFWCILVGGTMVYISLYGVNQTQVQRLQTVRTLELAQRALWIQIPILALMSLATSLAGLVIYAKYGQCDPIKTKIIDKPDQLLPYFVMDTMRHIPGLAGLFIAGIFSGAISTVSSAINSLTAVTLEDYVKPFCTISFIPESVLSKLMALFYGLLCLCVAFLAEYLGGVLQASLTIFGVMGGPLLGLFTVGIFIKHVEQVGAVTGLLSGLAMNLWTGFGGPKPPPQYLPQSVAGCGNATVEAGKLEESVDEDRPHNYFPLYRLSYRWVPVLGFLVTVLVAVLVSWIRRMLQRKLQQQQHSLQHQQQETKC